VAASETPVQRRRAGAARRSPWAALRMAPAMLTALVALGSSAIALAFTLWPRLAPDPGTTYRAQVSVFAVERGVTGTQFVQRSAFSPAHRRAVRAALLGMLGVPGSGAGVLAAHGAMAYVASTVEGFKHGSVELRWSLYKARTLRRVSFQGFGDVIGAQLDLTAPTDRTMLTLWIPPTPGLGLYRLRVALYDKDETLLDVADSAPFRGVLP